MTFDGDTITPDDFPRLNRQLRAVYELMRDGYWRGLKEIAFQIDEPEASISARLRDLRKPKWGGFTVERMNRGGGFWMYRLAPKSEPCFFHDQGAAHKVAMEASNV